MIRLFSHIFRNSLLFFILFFPWTAFSQNDSIVIDSLKRLVSASGLKSQIYCQLADVYTKSSPEKSLDYARLALAAAENEGNEKTESRALCAIGNVNYIQGDYNEALRKFEDALLIDSRLKIDSAIAADLNYIGWVYEAQAQYDKALEFYNKALSVNKKLNNAGELAKNYSNIGIIYNSWGKYSEALEYFDEAIRYDQKSKSMSDLAIDYNNKGLTYCYMKDFDRAIDYFNKALEIDRSIGNEAGIAPFLNNIGLVYYKWGKFDLAQKYFQDAIDLSLKLGNFKDVVTYQLNLAAIYSFKMDDPAKGILLYEKSLDICLENGYLSQVATIYKAFYKIYLKKEDYKKALDNYLLYTQTKDSIFNQDSRKSIERYKIKYETEKKENEITALKQQRELQNEKINKRNFIIYAVSAGSIIFLVLIGLVFRAYRNKKRMFDLVKKQKEEITNKNQALNQQNEEILAQRDEILAQRDEIEKQRDLLENKNREITDSIRYAKRIQRAVLPPEEYVTKSLPEHFILFLPRDIVSGDFYWAHINGDELTIAAIDCTGHGIPGAFMSMLGVSFLNEIVTHEKSVPAAEILNQLRRHVIRALHQTGKDGGSLDGMDAAVCVINESNKSLMYAGANIPLWLFRNGVISEYLPDKMPIGYYERANEYFTEHAISLQSGDQVYIFSDGYYDQFGGPGNRKMGKRGFREFLNEIQIHTMEEQKTLLRAKFHEWKGLNAQLDDVLVVGVKIK